MKEVTNYSIALIFLFSLINHQLKRNYRPIVGLSKILTNNYATLSEGSAEAMQFFSTETVGSLVSPDAKQSTPSAILQPTASLKGIYESRRDIFLRKMLPNFYRRGDKHSLRYEIIYVNLYILFFI